MRLIITILLIALAEFAVSIQAAPQSSKVSDWPNYGNDAGGMRYSSLTQIHRGNVGELRVAWVYHTGDISEGGAGRRGSGLETTPILVDGTLYLTTPFNRIIALDPETGKERWAYDPKIDRTWDSGDGLINRGVATWVDSRLPAGKVCRRRIFEATIDARLVAVDSRTGAPCVDFGDHGQVSLRNVPGFRPGWYHMTSPPAVVGDIVVVGSSINDNSRTNMPSGIVRGYDVRSGALRWSWDPISKNPSDHGWETGASNAWSIMAVDQERKLVFIPTGSASPDFFGGLRPGDNRWADSVVALRGDTGEFVWGFQLVHHDLWDYDTAAPPLLASLDRNGSRVPVVVEGNKTGYLFVLDRATGKPVFGVEERPVPKSEVPGEAAFPTQPFPVAPPQLNPGKLSEEDAWGVTPEDREACRQQLSDLRNDGIFTPPSLKGSLSNPGILGGMTWSGYAFEPTRNLLFVNTNNLPWKVRLIPRKEFEDKPKTESGDYDGQTGAPYGVFRRPLLSPGAHLPCVTPPWGMLSAIDLSVGKIRWQVPLGSFQPGHVPEGTISLGGPIVTAGDLIFIAGTLDPFIRAFDVETGKELWKSELPTSAHATPMTYQLKPDGKQFVVISSGGNPHIDGEKKGDAVIAFTLP